MAIPIWQYGSSVGDFEKFRDGRKKGITLNYG
jgi:hypothetical protein